MTLVVWPKCSCNSQDVGNISQGSSFGSSVSGVWAANRKHPQGQIIKDAMWKVNTRIYECHKWLGWYGIASTQLSVQPFTFKCTDTVFFHDPHLCWSHCTEHKPCERHEKQIQTVFIYRNCTWVWTWRWNLYHSPYFPSFLSPRPCLCSLTAVEHYLSGTNYMDCISSMNGSNGCSLNASLKGSELPELFSKLGLGKYIDVFQQQEVGLNILFNSLSNDFNCV